MSLDLTHITELVVAEAIERLADDQYCQGGLNAKIHSVLMDLGLLVGQVMARSRTCQGPKPEAKL